MTSDPKDPQDVRALLGQLEQLNAAAPDDDALDDLNDDEVKRLTSACEQIVTSCGYVLENRS